MLKRSKDINKFLETLANIYIQNPDVPIEFGSVYHYLTRSKESDKLIKQFHDKWVNDFRNIPNIKVFIDKNWSYFCQFTNDTNTLKDEYIKLYLPVDISCIDRVANNIFRFLAANDIKHHSKIGSDERRDVIVIRLEDEKDLPMIQKFVSSDKILKKGLVAHSPFTMNDGVLGYACDGKLSYNSVVYSYIKNYLRYKRNKNELKKVSCKDFLQYCQSIYTSCFVDMNPANFEWFIQNFDVKCEDLNSMTQQQKEQYISNMAPILNNYRNVTKLILTSLQTNNLNYFHHHFNECKDMEKQNTYITNIRYRADSSLMLVRNCVECMINKHGLENTVKYLKHYAKTGDTNCITKDNNYRKLIPSYFDISTFEKYLDIVLKDLNIDIYNQKSSYASINQSSNLDLFDIIKGSVDETLLKQNNVTTNEQFYRLEKIYAEDILTNIIEKNIYNSVTSQNNARKNLCSLGQGAVCLELIRGAVTQYVVDCMQKTKVNYSCGDSRPRSVEETVNFITRMFFEKSVEETYNIILTMPEIRNFLIRNYVKLLTDTTKELRNKALSTYSIPNLQVLDSMQQQLIEMNQRNLINAGVSY